MVKFSFVSPIDHESVKILSNTDSNDTPHHLWDFEWGCILDYTKSRPMNDQKKIFFFLFWLVTWPKMVTPTIELTYEKINFL